MDALLSPGATLGPYKIDVLIGQGGMGEVYRATDTRLGRPVAIKVSAREFSDRFEREALAISSLNHPNICTLYDVGPNYLVMELVEGETLLQAIQKGPVPLDKALQYAIQITDALAAAHAKGIVHRDLKPGNIVLTRNGVKVLDFGLAKFNATAVAGDLNASNAATRSEPITNKGTILGTLQYLSPEQAEGKEATERSDIFAFGAVFYEMVTGKRAFQGETQTGILASILRDQPPPVTQVQPVAPRAVDRIIRKCLEKKPEDRWHSAHDLKPALELIDLDASIISSSGVKAPVEIPRRRSWLLPAVAAIALVSIAGLVFELWPTAKSAGRVTRFETPLPEGAVVSANNFYVRVSPDGTKLAFTTNGQQGGIWVRDLESVEARLLTGTVGGVSPFWSPDSKSIAYGAGTRLMRVEIAGGPPQLLCESATPVGSGFWTPQGEIVFGGRGLGPLQRVAAAGGIPVALTILANGESFHTLPSLLPDGRHFLYKRGNDLYAGSLDVGPEKQSLEKITAAPLGVEFVRDGTSADGNLFFIRDGTLMAQHFDAGAMKLSGDPIPVAQQVGRGPSHGHFSVTARGVLAYRVGAGTESQLTWVDRQGRPLETIGDPREILSLALSPDESQVALFRSDTRQYNQGDLLLLDLPRRVETRFTFGQSVSMAARSRPVWSPDGKEIAFIARGTPNKLATKPANGSGDPRTILDPGGFPWDWSKDGRYLIYGEPQGQGAVRVLPVGGTSGGGAPPLIPGQSDMAVLSPDGRWIAYATSDSGQTEVFIQPFNPPGQQPARTGGKYQVSRNGGAAPRWSGDGKELFFVSAQNSLVAATIEISGDSLRALAPVKLFDQSMDALRLWDVSRDGKRFLVAKPPDHGANAPITVIENWQAALKH